MAADADPATLDDREQGDLDVVAQHDVMADDHTTEGDARASPDAIAEERPVCPDLQRARKPPEAQQVAEWDARPGNERAGHDAEAGARGAGASSGRRRAGRRADDPSDRHRR